MVDINSKFQPGPKFKTGNVPGSFDKKLGAMASSSTWHSLKKRLSSIETAVKKRSAKIRSGGLTETEIKNTMREIESEEVREKHDLSSTAKGQTLKILKALSKANAATAKKSLEQKKKTNIKKVMKAERVRASREDVSYSGFANQNRLQRRLNAIRAQSGNSGFAQGLTSGERRKLTALSDIKKKGGNEYEKLANTALAFGGQKGSKERLGVKMNTGFAGSSGNNQTPLSSKPRGGSRPIGFN